MRTILNRRTAAIAAGLAATGLIATACATEDTATTDSPAAGYESSSAYAPSSSSASASAVPARPVRLRGADGTPVILTGPIAAKYSAATAAQKQDLGRPLTGDHNSGKRANGTQFQQFTGGVITARDAGAPAYITWGLIRDAWNVERAPDGTPSDDGKNGSAGPLGAATSDEVTTGDIKASTFEHGKITYNTQTRKVTVTVNGKVVPTN
ncbi:MAG: hypothetical protein QM728_07455 [Gordonia sp. (in: high G+C Gram-positive bacteria)]|uniref:LGFP repeat-containing protein n=1 Tax=Gordonia sp. (in: high G+C Gram-positive bacteria) TaxID=84139 RepID=UPI0039E33BF2